MDDVKRRLQFGNPSIKFQAIGKLLALIDKNKTPNSSLIGSQTQIPELSLLWELTDDACPVVSNCCCQALVALVINGKAEYDYVLNNFLNLIPSAKHVNGSITAVRDLVLFQALLKLKSSENDNSSSKFKIHQHPFITILRHCSQSWPYLLQHVKYLLQGEDKRFLMLNILSPFLWFVLKDPNHSTSFSHFRKSLFHILQTLYSETEDNNILNILLECIPWLKVDNIVDLIEASQYVQDLARLMLNHHNNHSSFDTDSLLPLLASLSLLMMKENIDCSECLKLLHKLILRRPQVSGNIKIDATALLVSQMLDISSPVYHSLIIELGETLMNQHCCSSLVIGSLILPLLRIVTIPSSYVVTLDGRPSPQPKAVNLVKAIESTFLSGKSSKNYSENYKLHHDVMWESIDENLSYAYSYAKLARKLQQNTHSTKLWLEYIESNANLLKHTDNYLLPLISAVIIHGLQDKQLVIKSITVAISIANVDAVKAPSLFPVLLHKLGIETDIDLRLHILHNLPELGRHKLTVGPVLQTLQMLSTTSTLKALTIRLTAHLWKYQDRVFPFLHHLILEEDDEEVSVSYDIVISKAASIRDVCQTNPQLYGADFLASLSAILGRHRNEMGIVPSVLALDGIIALCKAEVIDLRTTWKVLAPKLSKDNRPQIIKKLCELLSLTTELEVLSPEFESFQVEVVNYLWKQICSNKDPLIVGAAFRALAAFKSDIFRLKSLPEKAKENLKVPTSLAATPFEKAKKPEEVLSYIPGACYTKLLLSLDKDLYPDYGYFLKLQVKDEVKCLPRGVYHSALRVSKILQNNKILAAIPQLLAIKHENNKVVGLQNSLAGGVLLCYEPPVEYGKDGQPLKRSFATKARAYQQRLEFLLNEVPIEAAEWQRSLALSQAWTHYMERAYFVSVEGRKAELDMQQKHGTFQGSSEEFEVQMNSAWLWARDRIADILRGKAKGKPASQGNAVLALGGLTAAVSKYATSLDPGSKKKFYTESSEHLGHDYWMNVVLETILSIIEPSQTKSRIFTWFQNTGKGQGSLSVLVRACACMSVVQLTSNIFVTNPEKGQEIIELLQCLLKDSDSPALQLYTGISIGLILSHLYQDHFSDGQDCTFLDQSVKSLMEYAIADDMDNKIGSVLGLTVAACAMSFHSNPDIRLNAADIHSLVVEKMDSENSSSVIYEVLCMSLVCITASACTANILSVDTAESVLVKLEDILKKTPNNCGVAAALGLLIHWLQRISYVNAAEMKDHLLKVWLPVLASEAAPTLARLSAVHGLCSMFGMQSSLMQLREDNLEPDSDVGLNELLNIMTQIVSLSKDIGLQNCCAWMLGQLYYVNVNKGEASSSLPLNYTYLNDSSILKSVVDYINEEVKNGKYSEDDSPSPFLTCLETLAQEFPRALPPLNWNGLLGPVLRSVAGKLQKKFALQTAIRHSGASSSATVLVTTWMVTPLFQSLPIECQKLILESLPRLIKTLPVLKLRQFFGTEVITFFQNDGGNNQIRLSFLQGLYSALRVPDPPQGITLLLFETTETLFKLISKDDEEVFKSYCKCLMEMPDEVLDRMTIVIPGQDADIEKILAVKVYLIVEGKEPLNWLNQTIDYCAMTRCHSKNIVKSLANCFNPVEPTDVDVCISWILGIMGQIKNLIEWKSQLQIVDTDHMCQVVEFLLNIFAVAVLGWCGDDLCFVVWPKQDQDFLNWLPLGLRILLSKEPFDQILSKVIDWLLYLCESTVMAETYKQYFKATLCFLRQTKDYNKSSVWTRVISVN